MRLGGSKFLHGGFGGNNGRQGSFDPNDRMQRQNATDRKAQLEAEWGERLNPRFTGRTGLASNDAQGYSRMLNARTEYQNILRGMEGRGPMNVEWGGTMASDPTPSTVWDANQVPASVEGIYNAGGYNAGDIWGDKQTRRLPSSMRRLRPRGNAEDY